MRNFLAGLLLGLIITVSGCTIMSGVGGFLGYQVNQPPVSDKYETELYEGEYPFWVLDPPKDYKKDCVCKEDVEVKFKF